MDKDISIRKTKYWILFINVKSGVEIIKDTAALDGFRLVCDGDTIHVINSPGPTWGNTWPNTSTTVAYFWAFLFAAFYSMVQYLATDCLLLTLVTFEMCWNMSLCLWMLRVYVFILSLWPIIILIGFL